MQLDQLAQPGRSELLDLRAPLELQVQRDLRVFRESLVQQAPPGPLGQTQRQPDPLDRLDQLVQMEQLVLMEQQDRQGRQDHRGVLQDLQARPDRKGFRE